MEILGPDQQLMEAALQVRSARAAILAGNVANADTPGYIGRDLDFDRALAEQLSAVRSATDQAPNFTAVMRADGVEALRPDGNNVDLNQQLARSYQNSLDYVATLKLYGDSVGRLRSATTTS
ncbi:MAG TPA: flagellar basal body rod protein FlgB [Candidatus Binataceae bacterium]|nr:flagellar basal body rod protein FlgB [Candidatus Binataceae bacterium]